MERITPRRRWYDLTTSCTDASDGGNADLVVRDSRCEIEQRRTAAVYRNSMNESRGVNALSTCSDPRSGVRPASDNQRGVVQGPGSPSYSGNIASHQAGGAANTAEEHTDSGTSKPPRSTIGITGHCTQAGDEVANEPSERAGDARWVACRESKGIGIGG